MNRREFLKATGTLGAALAVYGLAGCTSAVTDNKGSDSQAKGGQKKGPLLSAEFTVTHFPSLMYGVPWLVAQQKGYFKEAGIDLKGIVGSEGGGTTVRNVITGGLPFGEVATPAVYKAFASGAPLVAVGGGVRSIAEINWVTMPNRSDINSIKDFKGKKVGYTSPGSVTEGLINLCLAKVGINPKEVQLIAMGGVSKGLTALKEGALDAAANLEPVYSAQKKDWKLVFWAKEYVPNFLQTLIIVGPELVKSNPDAIRAVLKARAQGLEDVIKNLDGAAEIYAKASNQPKEICLSALKSVDPKQYYAVGLDSNGLQAVEEEMRIVNLLKKDEKIPWKEFTNQNFLPEGTAKVNF